MGNNNAPQSGPSTEFRSLSQKAASEFLVDKVSAPTSLYIQDDSVLLINLTNISVAQQTIIVRATMLRSADGELTTSETIVTVGSLSALPALVPVNLCEGFLLQVAAFGATLNAGRGSLYAEVYLARNPGSDTKYIQTLIASYLIGNRAISWPGSSVYLPPDGAGQIANRGQGNPAAGAESTQVINPLTRCRLISYQATFTASATVATRFPALVLDFGAGNGFCTAGDQVGVTANQVVTFSWFAGAMHTTNNTANNRSIPIPENCLLRVNSRIRTLTQNIQAADQWSNLLGEFEEWVDG